ncbi:uncharacterized protein LOC142329471 isoform X2 [Lycorma delicatula]|uniref:uncharacterized protein LOC142329471 isoform X2 n=1 Tax=Lycorma delicatula TaxID=130591 RepID=UPI003F518636
MKSPDEEDTRDIALHDPAEVVRTANLLVDEVIAKAHEEALIKYQKKQEEDEIDEDFNGDIHFN